MGATDLSRKIAQLQHKENKAPVERLVVEPPPLAQIIQKSNQQRSLLAKANKQRSQSPQQQQVTGGSGGVGGATTTTTAPPVNGNRKRLSMSDVSDMLYEFYKAKAPKTQYAHPLTTAGIQAAHKFGQTSPTSAETHEPSSIAAIATNGASVDTDATTQLTISKNLQSDEMLALGGNVGGNGVGGGATSTAAFHPRIKYTNKSAGEGVYVKLVNGDKAIGAITAIPTSVVVGGPAISPLLAQQQHRNDNDEDNDDAVANDDDDDEPMDVKPVINPTTGLVMSPSSAAAAAAAAAVVSSVIKPVPTAVLTSTQAVPQAAAIAAALLRDGYHNFQQQMRAQEILKHHTTRVGGGGAGAQISSSTSGAANDGASVGEGDGDGMPTKILENFLRQHQQQQQQHHHQQDDADDEEDDARYNGFDDIHLVEGSATKSQFGNHSLPNLFNNAANSTGHASPVGGAQGPGGADYMSDESQKFMMAAQASVLRNLEYSLSDFANVGAGAGGGGGGGNGAGAIDGTSPNGSLIGADGEPVYECRHCGKKYRWKSTLRRHENVECGGKEPSHQCPYCPYKSKQRGNLGVHVRKHHSNLPQLASKRRSKYSTKLGDGGMNSANASDDSSSSKLVIDCSK